MTVWAVFKCKIFTVLHHIIKSQKHPHRLHSCPNQKHNPNKGTNKGEEIRQTGNV